VNRISIKLVSYLLLFCMLATIVPLNLLHHHQDKSHCDLSNIVLENDPCHIRIHHIGDVERTPCDHNSHIDEFHTECEFCKFLGSHSYTYVEITRSDDVCAKLSKSLITYESASIPSSLSNVIFSRGPPA